MPPSPGLSPPAPRPDHADLFVAGPNYKGASGAFIISMLQLHAALGARRRVLWPWFIENESNIDRARAKACAAFLKTSASHLLMCDTDMGWNAQDILRMIDADKPVIGAVMCAKEFNFDMLVQVARADGRLPTALCVAHAKEYLFSGPDPEAFGNLLEPQEIKRVGTGCMLIRRDVIETLWAKYGDTLGAIVDKDLYIVSLFEKYIDRLTGRQVGTDYAFCDRVRESGFSVWLAPWTATTHRGEYTFRASLLDMAME